MSIRKFISIVRQFLSGQALSQYPGRLMQAFVGITAVAAIAACGGSATTTGAVGDDSDGSVLIVSTFAGKAGEAGYANGQGSAARFGKPSGIAVDNFGNVYVADSGNAVVRKITPGGDVSLFAGTPGRSGNENGPPGTAAFGYFFAYSLAVDTFFNVYIADITNDTIKKINAFGVVSDFAQLDFSRSVAAAKDGTIYVVVGRSTFGLSSISAQGTVTQIFSSALNNSIINSVSLDNLGNRYVVQNKSIGRILAGTSVLSAFSDDLDVDTSLVPNPLAHVTNFAIDQNGNAFVFVDGSIRQVKPDGSVSIFAGRKNIDGSQDGLLLDARFGALRASLTTKVNGLAIAPDGSMYVADSNNHTIRKISKGFYVGGVVRGLTSSGTVNVQNNGGTTQSLSNGSFTFSMPVAQSATYTAQILSAEGHSCTMSNATGQVTTTVSSITVDCTPIVQPTQYSAGGVVGGLLAGQTVVLKNGADKTVALSNGGYTFLVKAPNATPYNVTVDQQPNGRTCSVVNGNSSINNANVVNVNVSCVTSTHSISGNVTGLGSGTLGVAINSSPTQTISANGRFTLTSAINYGDAFDVRITSQPAGQTCDLGSFGVSSSATQLTGTVSGDLAVPVICRTNTYTVTASVSGTSGAETVTLQMTGNPSGSQTLLLTGSASGTFANRASHGANLGLSVLTSPAGKTCSVTSPATVNVTGVSNVTVLCTVNAPVYYAVGGTVSGLPAMTTIDLLMASGDFASNQMATGISNSAYQFLTTVPGGSTISIATGPLPMGVTCTVNPTYATGAVGTVINANVTNADVICTGGSGGGSGGNGGGGDGGSSGTGPWTVTVAVTGLDSGESVTLQMLAGSPSINESLTFANAGPFQFATLVPDGTAVTVNLTASPAGKTCQTFAPQTITGGNRAVAVNCSASGGGGGGLPMLP
ncbi:MAG: hypothetical protein HC858_00275 [Brachymonas sp.]|nr:hypothetical protein [Brachymonas sp.]